MGVHNRSIDLALYDVIDLTAHMPLRASSIVLARYHGDECHNTCFDKATASYTTEQKTIRDTSSIDTQTGSHSSTTHNARRNEPCQT
jgi:hypothetical protein